MGVVYGIGLPTLLPSWVPWHFSCCPDKLVYAAGTGSNNRSNLFEKMDCNDKQLHQGWFPILIFIMMFWPCESRKEDVLFVATIKMPILAGSPVWWLGPSISVDQKIWWSLWIYYQNKRKLVGGFKHEFYFPFHIWDVILPIDELHHFSRWWNCTTNKKLVGAWNSVLFVINRRMIPWLTVASFSGVLKRPSDFDGSFHEILLNHHCGYLNPIKSHEKSAIPSGKHTKKLWKIPIVHEKIHYKWWCSIVM